MKYELYKAVDLEDGSALSLLCREDGKSAVTAWVGDEDYEIEIAEKFCLVYIYLYGEATCSLEDFSEVELIAEFER